MHPAFENLVKSGRLDNGLYWQHGPITVGGCTPARLRSGKVSPGCVNCWLAEFSHRMKSNPNPKIAAFHEGLTDDKGRWTGLIKFNIERFLEVARDKKPAVICPWGEPFHEEVVNNDEFMNDLFHIMDCYRDHIYILLTKRPHLMKLAVERFAPSLATDFKHVIAGTTTENQEAADERLPELYQVGAAHYMISYEPALGPLDLNGTPIGQAIGPCDECGEVKANIECDTCMGIPSLCLVVTGCESRGSYPCRPAQLKWFRDLRDQLAPTGASFFLKQAEIEKGRLKKAPFLDGHQHLAMPEVG